MGQEYEPRVLSADELAFCQHVCLEIGFDDDDEGKHQYRHICWPFFMDWGALCGSDRLWFQGGPVRAEDTIDCPACVQKLGQLRQRDPVLLAALGRLASAVSSLRGVEEAASDFVWELEHPGEANLMAPPIDARKRLDEALVAESSRWTALADTRGAPEVTADGWRMPEAHPEEHREKSC